MGRSEEEGKAAYRKIVTEKKPKGMSGYCLGV
jgi:hypothetical protein